MIRPSRTLAAALTVAALLAAQGRAEDPPVPPPWPGNDATAVPTLARMPSSRLRLGPIDIVLEETPLALVKDALAAGSIAEQGDASEHIFWLCYTREGGERRQRVWIISSGEFGGAEHAVDAIAAAVVDNEAAVPTTCPALPHQLSLALDHEVWLGVTRDDLIRRLGRPSRQQGDVLHFAYDGDAKLAGKPSDSDPSLADAAVTSHLMVELREGRVERLWASKTTSD